MDHIRLFDFGAGDFVPTSDLDLPDPVISTTGAIDYGFVQITKGQNATLNITNNGSTQLLTSSFTLSGDTDFSIVSNTAVNLAPGQTGRVVLRFDPTDVGLAEGTLTINSNGSLRPTLEIPLSGTGLPENTSAQYWNVFE